jgi:hypothetical protein
MTLNQATFQNYEDVKDLSSKKLTEDKAYQILRRFSTKFEPEQFKISELKSLEIL